MKRIVISCGPIPSKLDSIKYIGNRFKGGLAFKTAEQLSKVENFRLTIVKWKYTSLPKNLESVAVVDVDDVTEYYEWFKDNATKYDAFILAAAVANLMPSNPFDGKFPSHKYKVGEQFNIKFEIAPRAIDIIKQINPRSSLIGYKMFDGPEKELIDAAKITLADSKANIVFANTPSTAKNRKIAVMADGSIVPCSFDEHVELIIRQINQEYFCTNIVPMPTMDVDIKVALATVKLYECTFKNYGTVAVPVRNHKGWFATTSRGHKGNPVIVFSVDEKNLVVNTTGKATLNAPTLHAMLNGRNDVIVVHRHYDDRKCSDKICQYEYDEYLFPGTKEEMMKVKSDIVLAELNGTEVSRIKLYAHGDLSVYPIENLDWNQYYELFPPKYFTEIDKDTLEAGLNSGTETLELGSNRSSQAKYAFDKYVHCESAINLSEEEVFNHEYDFVFAQNSINYFTEEFIRNILARTKKFAANTFRQAPAERINYPEVVVSMNGVVHHVLFNMDRIYMHTFYAYTPQTFLNMGLKIYEYGNNSMLVTKGD